MTTNWLSKDYARLALSDAIRSIKYGNQTDDKLILENLRKAGLWIGRIEEDDAPYEVFVTVSEGDPIDVYKSETAAFSRHNWKVVRYLRAETCVEERQEAEQ